MKSRDVSENNELTVWDYKADLKAGRVHTDLSTLFQFADMILMRVGLLEDRVLIEENINTLQEIQMAEQTANEKKILDAADALTTIYNEVKAGSDAKDTRIAQLEQALKDAQETVPPMPEDLTEEFATFDSKLGNLKSLADGMVPAPAGTPADSTTDPVEPATPVTPDIGSGTDGGPAHSDPVAPGREPDPVPPTEPTDPSSPVDGGATDEGGPATDSGDGGEASPAPVVPVEEDEPEGTDEEDDDLVDN